MSCSPIKSLLTVILIFLITPLIISNAQESGFSETFDDPALHDWDHSEGGRTWHETNPSIGTSDFFEWGMMKKVFFSPQLPGRVLGIRGDFECVAAEICGKGFSVVYSDDGGETWNPSDLNEGIVPDLAFSPDGSIYVVVYPGDIIYRSMDNGQTWNLVAEGIIPEIDSLVFDPDRPDQWLMSLAVDPVNVNKLYAGLNRGAVLVSEDGGVSWFSSSAGMNPESMVMDIVADPANPDVIYAATPDSGVFLSTDGGATWRAINDG